MTRITTWVAVHVLLFAAIAWDIYVAIEPTPRDTISYITLETATKHPSIAVLSGMLLGHLFWPMAMACDTLTWWKVSLPVIGVLWLGFAAVDYAMGFPRATPAIWFLVGFVVGHIGWPQKA